MKTNAEKSFGSIHILFNTLVSMFIVAPQVITSGNSS